jgi:hypothetical protein
LEEPTEAAAEKTPRGRIHRIPVTVYYSVPAFLVYVMAMLVAVVSCSRQPDTDVVADTATGDVAMIAVGKLGIGGELSLPLSTTELQKASRVFGVRVRQGPIRMAKAQVWLCREQPPGGCILIGREAEPEGQGYRIAFRDFTADPSYQHWKDDRSTSRLLLHSHDRAWALDVAPDKSEKQSFLIVVGAPGAEGYAVRLAR